MAIQQIDLAVPNGDTVRSANNKINENFSNTTHAASRLVGTEDGQVATWQSGNIEGTKKDDKTNLLLKVGDSVPENSAASRLVGSGNTELVEYSKAYKATFSVATIFPSPYNDCNDIPRGERVLVNTSAPNAPPSKVRDSVIVDSRATHAGRGYQFAITYGAGNEFFLRNRFNDTTDVWQPWVELYHTGNAHEHGANGYLKPSSPIVMIYNNSIQSNNDAEIMGAVFAKKGVGDYEITNTTGLRSDGWYIEIPNDLHGNPHVAVTIEDTEGTIRLKCFKRVFNMQTFKFEPDLDSPMDIPEGRWIDLRFNDLPQEQLVEPIE